MKSIWAGLTFKAKLLTINLSILGLLAAGIGVSFFQLVTALENAKYNELKTQRAAGASQVAALFFERYGDVQAFAANPVVATQDYQNMPEYLDRYAAIYGIYDHIMYVSPQGKWLAGSTKDVRGKSINTAPFQSHDFAKDDWFQRALAKEWNQTPSGLEGTVVSPLQHFAYMEAAFSENVPRQIFATTLFDKNGEVQGVLVNVAHPKWVTDGMSETMAKKYQAGDTDFLSWITQGDQIILKSWLEKDGTPKFEFPMVAANLTFGAALSEVTYNHKVPQVLAHSGSKYVTAGGSITDTNWSAELGWNVIYEDKEELFFKETRTQTLFGAVVVVLSLLLGIIGIQLFSVAISKRLESVLTKLDGFGQDVSGTSTRLLKGSQELASASTQQAAGVQETMAAIEEISAMVARNADAADRSQSQSLEAEESAARGHETVQKMLESMQLIKESNEHYSAQLAEANERLSQITNAINEIAGKTKVINEIVFQTKLLSFNASVEAARAGEYGKGFAVVAEEVGNLAAMSGQAAQEISKLLEKSTSQVTEVVDESKNLSATMVQDIQERVEVAEQVASEVAHSLQEILNNSQKVAGMTAEIASASKEQSSGVSEISKAIGEIEVGVQKVNQNANQTANDSTVLSEKVMDLSHGIDEIRSFLKGSNSSSDKILRQKANVVALKEHQSNYKKAS